LLALAGLRLTLPLTNAQGSHLQMKMLVRRPWEHEREPELPTLLHRRLGAHKRELRMLLAQLQAATEDRQAQDLLLQEQVDKVELGLQQLQMVLQRLFPLGTLRRPQRERLDAWNLFLLITRQQQLLPRTTRIMMPLQRKRQMKQHLSLLLRLNCELR
jgi:hypothetical protein